MTANWAGAPRTWVDGPVTAADLDTEIRDRMDWLRAVLALHGMDSADTLGALGGAKYGCYVTASRSVSDATDTVINWSSEDWDSGFWSASPNAGRVTVPSGGGGLYLVVCNGRYDPDADGFRGMWLTKNGTGSYARDNNGALGASWDVTLRCLDLLVLAAGDYLQAVTRHSANNALNITASLALYRLARA